MRPRVIRTLSRSEPRPKTDSVAGIAGILFVIAILGVLCVFLLIKALTQYLIYVVVLFGLALAAAAVYATRKLYLVFLAMNEKESGRISLERLPNNQGQIAKSDNNNNEHVGGVVADGGVRTTKKTIRKTRVRKKKNRRRGSTNSKKIKLSSSPGPPSERPSRGGSRSFLPSVPSATGRGGPKSRISQINKKAKRKGIQRRRGESELNTSTAKHQLQRSKSHSTLNDKHNTNSAPNHGDYITDSNAYRQASPTSAHNMSVSPSSSSILDLYLDHRGQDQGEHQSRAYSQSNPLSSTTQTFSTSTSDSIPSSQLLNHDGANANAFYTSSSSSTSSSSPTPPNIATRDLHIVIEGEGTIAPHHHLPRPGV